MPVAGSEDVALFANADEAFPVGWSQNSTKVLFASHREGSLGLWAIPVGGGKAQGAPTMIHRDVGGVEMRPMGITRSGAFYYAIAAGESNGWPEVWAIENFRPPGK